MQFESLEMFLILHRKADGRARREHNLHVGYITFLVPFLGVIYILNS